MSRDDSHEPPDYDHPLQAIAGILASGVSGQLARPLRELRESLAVMVETLDNYISAAEGPTPYPWRSIQLLRQEIGQAYLLSRETARMASELYEAVTMTGGVVEAIDINKQIEAAVNLARHRIGGSTELFMDLGSIPPIRGVAGEWLLALAKLIICCADSASGREGSAISIKTCLDGDGDDGDTLVIYIADNGSGNPAAAASARRTLEPLVHRLGGTFDGISEVGQGSVFECRIPGASAAGAKALP